MQKRSILQNEADSLDLEVFRLVEKLSSFATRHRLDDIHNMAATIRGLRYRVRKHMHADDRQVTS
jgi:hypothetical protein